MKCHKCGSVYLTVILSGPHKKLVCMKCLAFQKFLSKKDAEVFEKIRDDRQDKKEG